MARPLHFALVAKTVDEEPFIYAARGCAEAAQAEGDTCILLGPSGPTHFRKQDPVLSEALALGLDGIALSVTNSRWLALHSLQRLGLTPLITFDSDLEPEEQYLRRAYVGQNNLEVGRRLGLLAQRLRPGGGRVYLLSGGHSDPNLNARLQGVRQQLSGRPGIAERLSGENGWISHERCPLYGADDQELVLKQLTTILQSGQIDIIISLGSWPIFDVGKFRQRLGPLLAELEAKGRRPDLIIGIGEPSEAELALLDDGLVQGYLSMNFTEIGRESYRVLKRLAQGESVPMNTFIDSRIYLPKR